MSRSADLASRDCRRCTCGAGDPCVCNRSADIDAGIEEPDVSKI